MNNAAIKNQYLKYWIIFYVLLEELCFYKIQIHCKFSRNMELAIADRNYFWYYLNICHLQYNVTFYKIYDILNYILQIFEVQYIFKITFFLFR